MRRLGLLILIFATVAGLSWLALSGHAQPPARDLPKPTITQTAPQQAKRGAVVFCVFGDCRSEGDPKRLSVTTRLAAAMAEERPQVVLGTGDYIDGTRTVAGNRQQLDAFLRSLAPLQKHGQVPLAAAVGNHDRAMGSEVFRATFGPAYYSFNLGNCHFIVLDTEQPGETGRITGKQWDWLVQDLQQAQALPKAQRPRFTFVTLHQPLFPVDGHRGESLDRYPRFRDTLHQLFVQQNVTCVFEGHEHLYNRQERDGVVYVITGGGGAPLYASELKGGFYHYLRVDVTATGYTVAVKRL
jgi:hypothetical protein